MHELLDDQENSQLGDTHRDRSLIWSGLAHGSGRLFFHSSLNCTVQGG